MSFHGRGFFPALSQETNLHDPLVMLAVAEAIIGLLIEISFIATFTQRFLEDDVLDRNETTIASITKVVESFDVVAHVVSRCQTRRSHIVQLSSSFL